MDPLNTTPIPKDIPLGMPADQVFLQALLVVLFLLHILFVNLMVGGSLLTLALEIAGRWRREWDRLAREIAKTITVNKSLAVVLGVGPLLAINVLYTVYFYSANALTGSAWIMIIPLVSLAFLVTYAHKYSWDRLANAKGLHIAIGGIATLLFLAVPLIFLANINLMLFPERWGQVQGFLSTLLLPNVLPRYLHFLLASVAVAALFFLFHFNRSSYPLVERLPGIDRRTLRRLFYGVALGASLAQLLFGPLVLLTLPPEGMSGFLLLVITGGAGLGISAMVLMWREVNSPGADFQRRFVTVVILITGTAFAMGYGRHLYRESAIDDHRRLMAERTTDFGWASSAALWRVEQGISREQVPVGEKIFQGTCSSCHAVDRVLVGPPLLEIARIYADNPAGIAAWTANPGKKRDGFPMMPAFRLGEDKLIAVAEYILQLGSGEPAEDAVPDETAPAAGIRG